MKIEVTEKEIVNNPNDTDLGLLIRTKFLKLKKKVTITIKTDKCPKWTTTTNGTNI